MRAVKFANTILVVAVLYLMVAGSYLVYKEVGGTSGSFLLYGVLVASIIVLLLVILRGSKSHRVNLALFVCSFAFTLYALEAFLFFLGNPLDYRDARYTAAQRDGISFDRRTPLEVVSDLKEDGVDAYPYVAPSTFVSETHTINGEELFALGGHSNVTTVFCNEMGEYILYESDEYGFHNPKGIWGEKRLDIAAVGDSFTQGACVASDKNTPALIRAVYPHTLNLGYSGNGPLIMLASLKEYLEPLKPNVVLWFYYEGNDLGNLYLEQANPLLRQYLADPDFEQELLQRQSDVDGLISDYVADFDDDIRANASREVLASLRLYHVRRLLSLDREPATVDDVATKQIKSAESQLVNLVDTQEAEGAQAQAPTETKIEAPAESPLVEGAETQEAEGAPAGAPAESTISTIEAPAESPLVQGAETQEAEGARAEALAETKIEGAANSKIKDAVDANDEELVALFEEILSQTDDDVASWGGKLYFVYLPDHSRYEQAEGSLSTPRQARDTASSRTVEDILYRTQVLSMVNRLQIPVIDIHQAFRRHPDPLSLFPFRLTGHYTEEGYRIVAEEVLNAIEDQMD